MRPSRAATSAAIWSSWDAARAEPLLGACDFETAVLELRLDLAARCEHVLLRGDLGLLAHGVGLTAGGGQLALGLGAQRLRRAAAAAQHEGDERGAEDESHHKGQVLLRACRSPWADRRAPCGPVQ